jgi:LAO/AO transport system kinase
MRKRWTVDELVAGVAAGDSRALARAISQVENHDPDAPTLVRALYPRTGDSFVLGVTGPPGVGKSSLIGRLIHSVRRADRTAGVVSVDPSSPFTQGALLGDRIRLSEHFLDDGVYIRSMGTRGHLGGLAEAALQTTLLLDAAGCDVVFLETVGAGQSEVEVIGIADVVLLVLMPGSGDSVQALKAGIMEIPDVIAVNKMDHPAAHAMAKEVRSVVTLDPDASRRPPVVLTEAVRGEGVEELWSEIEQRREALAADGRLEERRRRNLAAEVLNLATARARTRIDRAVTDEPALAALVERVGRRELDPVSAADEIVTAVLGADGDGPADAR